MSSSQVQALERAGLRCRELEDQLKVRQETLRAVQAESVVLEKQLEVTHPHLGMDVHHASRTCSWHVHGITV